MKKRVTYKTAGVNIAKAEEFVKGIKGCCSKSKLNSFSAFGSLFDLKPFSAKCKNPVLVSSTDGVGTKLLIAQKLKIHNTVGIDLVAMNVNDIACTGAKPLFFLDYIACGKVEVKTLTKIVEGISKGLKESGCMLLGGETAEMPGMYKKEEYDLAGFCVGVIDKDKIINGKSIKPGDTVIGVESSGLHSNGFSLVRKALSFKDIEKNAKDILKPTRIYVKAVLSLPCPVKGIAHVTGGAFYDKATKILPPGLGMAIDKNSWEVPGIFRLIQEKGNISEKEMYSVFNMGIGLIVVVDKKLEKKALAHLNKFYRSYIIDEAVKNSRKMLMLSACLTLIINIIKRG